MVYDWLASDELVQFSEVFDYSAIGVNFIFNSGAAYTIRWFNGNRIECLTSEVFNPPRTGPDSFKVDRSVRWHEVLGATVVDQYHSYIETGSGEMAPWCTRLVFDNGHSIVVFLGDVDSEGRPIASADSLLVTSDEDAARGYELHSGQNAWPEA
ncbi:hypothetical protein [Microbacterium sp. NPDC056052]|uniref:hypothetical protein n=1 Tax=Microbacterium sp. NPDC056052 TaxID=3345695 RepID=UPI0035E302E4